MTDISTARHWIATSFGNLDGLHEDTVEVPAPAHGEVTIDVKAVGMNPADFKMVLNGKDPALLPVSIGYEVAGVIVAAGPDTELEEGRRVGDPVLAFRVPGGYTTRITVSADDVFAKPETLDFPEAANLLLAGATAAEMLHVTGVASGETILVHGASGAVGVSILQQAKLLGVRVVGTASQKSFDVVRRFGGDPVTYGEGLEDRVRDEAPEGIAAALDCVGTDEAIDVSLALVEDRGRIVTIAAPARAADDGFRAIGGAMPASKAFRDEVREHLVHLAAEGDLVVPMATTYPFAEAKAALEFLSGEHPGGKLALIP
jgi:NADPH:quinone reductase-like Zn-dependent oxidoreductase